MSRVSRARPVGSVRETPPSAVIVGAAGADQTSAEHALLITTFSLAEYVGFMAGETTEGRTTASRDGFGDEWRAAHDRLRMIEEADHDGPDHVLTALRQLPSELHLLRDRVLSDALVRRTLGTVPIDVALIDLEGLVVFQRLMDLSYVAKVHTRLGEQPSPQDIFEFCLPLDRSLVPGPEQSRLTPNLYALASPSKDFRFLQAMSIDPADISDLDLPALTTNIVAFAFGYSANCLSVIRLGTRFVLNNGSHRAYALLAAGHRYVPCIIQAVTAVDELEMIANPDFVRSAQAFLEMPRPPMLCDFFDPALTRRIQMTRRIRQVRLSFGIEQTDVPVVG